MDAIRKKMQSLKGETDVLYATIARFEGITKDANSQSDQHEADIRDLGKKIQGYESDFDETNDKFIKAMTALEEKEKAFKTAEEEVRQFFKLKIYIFLLNLKIDAFQKFCTIFHKLLCLLTAVYFIRILTNVFYVTIIGQCFNPPYHAHGGRGQKGRL